MRSSSKTTTFILTFLIAVFAFGYLYIKLFPLRSLHADLDEGNKRIETLKSGQTNQTALLEKISVYRNGLYALNLALEARKNVISGDDAENPYLVFNYSQVLNDLRRLLPRDARAISFQVNDKGLLTIPVESVDYASLGRVLKSFKDSKLFSQVNIPSGAQRTPRQTISGLKRIMENVYSFVIQAQLDPAFWQNPIPFTDVDKMAYYAQAIRDLAIAGTLEGYEDSTFRPDQPINRAEFFKMALFEFLAKDKITLEEYDKFTDLSEKDWHFKYMELAKQLGVIEPDKEGRFHPSQTISRMEALTMILKIYDIETEPETDKQEDEAAETEAEKEENSLPPLPFTDIPADYLSITAITAGLENGLLDQMGNIFKPNQSVTRAEVAYWVWKLKFDYL